MNSVSQYITSDSLDAYVVTVIRGHKQDGRIVVVVEADFDRKIYGQFYPQERFDVIFYERRPGCGRFVTLCEKLKDFRKRFCIIKDADFDRLNNVSYGFPNLFLTDTHDLETMMLTENFYNAVASEYEVDDAKSLINDALRGILHLSYIKWMNNVLDADLIFDAVRVGHCYNGVGVVSVRRWVDYIRDCNGGQIGSLNEEAVQTFEDDRPLDADALLQVTNGHDIVVAIERRLNCRKRRNIGTDNVKRLLSASFTIDDYDKTGLRKEMDIWLRSVTVMGPHDL